MMKKSKYSIGDKVYIFTTKDNTLHLKQVMGIELVNNYQDYAYTFRGNNCMYYEDEVFSSKEDFINHIKVEE